MGRLVEMRDALVHPIDRDRVLDQVVRADAEKIDFAREQIRRDRGGRESRSWRQFRVSSIEGLSFPLQFVSCILRRSASARRNSSSPEIIGNMILTLPTALARRMARSCVLKMSRFSRQNRIARQPRKGFSSSPLSIALGEFVAAEIEGANDQRMRRDPLRHVAIGRELLLLRRQRRLVEIEKFGPIKADAFGAVAEDRVHFLGQLDIGREDDVAAVAGGRFGLAQLRQLFRDRAFLAFDLAVMPAAFLRSD